MHEQDLAIVKALVSVAWADGRVAAEELEVIEALHKPFDPSVHEALMQQPSQEHPPGTVIEQVAAGYRLRDRVLRPAQVIVSAAIAPASEGQCGGSES